VGTNNIFYHNIFTNNNKNVYDSWNNLTAPNVWDNGEEGNFWGDYNGTDDNRDGIGDTPYVINDDNIDYYPLMVPYENDNANLLDPTPNPTPTAELFSTTLVAAAAGMSLAIIGVGLLVYFKKRKP
jgi:hypothetical protein